MEYKKKSLANLDIKKDYEEIDTRLASGWYVDDIHISNKSNDIKYVERKVGCCCVFFFKNLIKLLIILNC